jgi:hypothetical protein
MKLLSVWVIYIAETPHLLLGVTGSVAAIKLLELLTELTRFSVVRIEVRRELRIECAVLHCIQTLQKDSLSSPSSTTVYSCTGRSCCYEECTAFLQFG